VSPGPRTADCQGWVSSRAGEMAEPRMGADRGGPAPPRSARTPHGFTAQWPRYDQNYGYGRGWSMQPSVASQRTASEIAKTLLADAEFRALELRHLAQHAEWRATRGCGRHTYAAAVSGGRPAAHRGALIKARPAR
jgi:hypothetical protein